MLTSIRFFGLVVVLNVIRYAVGGPIEGLTIMEPMHAVMPEYPGVFDLEFSTRDFAISLFYNFMLWFSAALMFHLAWPALSGPMWIRSLKVFGVMALFFCSLAAVYMNHYVGAMRTFYSWSMVDALILFPLLGLANGLIYPLIMGRSPSAQPESPGSARRGSV